MEINLTDQNGKKIIVISGAVDEDANFDNVDLNSSESITIDLQNVDSINSCGIREWVKWVRSKSQPEKLSFINCPKVFIDQVNMVSGFIPEGSSVESFYVPYYNEETDNEKYILFSIGKEYDKNRLDLPEVKDDDGTEMELDVIEAKYFKFIKAA